MNDELPDVPLGAAAKQALDAARALAERPTDEQRLRMKAALLAKIGGAALTAGTGAKMAATAKSFSAGKLLVGLALAGGAVVSVVAVAAGHAGSRERSTPLLPAPPASASAARFSPPPPPPPAPPPSSLAAVDAGAAPPASASPRPLAAASVSRPTRDDEAFTREVYAVRSAQLHRAENEPTEVLAVLRPWTGNTGDPLRDERWSMQIEALCLTGKQAEGGRQRAAFLRALPSSPLASRVRGACAAGAVEDDSGTGF